LKKLSQILLIFVVFLTVSGAFAYSSVTVPIEDPVYRQLDKLAAHGLIADRLIGQRPYVRAEIARQIAEAMKNAAGLPSGGQGDYVAGLLRDLQAQYHDELVQNGAIEGKVPTFQGQPIEQGRMEFNYLNQRPAFFPSNNGFGGINAVNRSLVENRGGRHYQTGINLSFETMHWMRLGKYFSVQAEPRFQIQGVQGNEKADNNVFAQRLNGRFTWNKLDLEVGRDSLNWGPSGMGGLVFSNNARPLDFIKLSSVMPFYYPFFFKKLGINEWSLVVANLGPEQKFKDSWLVAYKNSNRGSKYLEVGISQTLVIGGDGAPPLSFGSSVAEFFGAGTHARESSDRNFAVEVIGTLPQARGINFYAELHFEDFDRNLSVLFGDDLSLLGGVYLPRLNDSGTLDLRVEYRRLSKRYSRHQEFSDGVTENRFLIGDPLGPDAYGVSVDMNYDLNRDTLLTWSLRFAQRNGDIYNIFENGDGVEGSVTRLSRPVESRFRAMAAVRHQFNPHVVARLGLGLEQVHNFNFLPNNDQTQWLGEAGLTFYFRPR